MSNLKKILPFIIIALIFLFFILWQFNTRVSDKAIGTLKSVHDTSVVISGKFDTGEKNKKQPEDITIFIGPNTKITKTSFERPVATSGGVFYPDKLAKKTENVDLGILREDSQHVAIGIEVFLKKSLYGGIILEASEIKYLAPKY